MNLYRMIGKTALFGLGGVSALAAVYWFNLDNKLIYYGVRPALNWWYDRQQRDVKL